MKLPTIFKKNERYLAVELLKQGNRATLFGLDRDRTISVRRTWFQPHEKGLERMLRALPKGKYPTLLILDPSCAATIPGAVLLEREHAHRVIDDGELENLISQAVWRFFDHYRPIAMARLGVNDLDLLLANIRILDVRLDGHHVFNPIGFTAKAVEVALEQTFVVRPMFDEVTKIIPKHTIEFITEAGVAGLQVLARSVPHKKFVLGNLFAQATSLYAFERRPHAAGHVSLPMAELIGTFPWGERQLLGSVMDELAVEYPIAKAIAARYIQKDLSPPLGRRLDVLISSGVTSLVRLLKSNVRLAHPFYLNVFYPLPLQNIAERHDVMVETVDIPSVLERVGFSFASASASTSANMPPTHFLSLAAFIEYYFSRRNEHLDRFAKRRARWLIP
ncbi:MAG: hypothetical protein A3G64_00655 [Candidatus Liptonbacteria bacterium RIFCSPLOWO2_12_FULL_60_15]|uniref:Uncharacterized protein n=2 Tax=Candidatus Liptoniibacteriota TaxID=1817909 RepID=A0A1G2CNA4_9BACT|nr:MAG: hypothetical protein A3E09_02370 [Candidatus Liptonbacteria bacterium RIFCSPHIGHO2_12_FULL_60_13]OGZ02839.1 MAG: hypothetical protein A3G64_00655 [Candidatus Liptonbacteria bacterium RIFCSPLOWO2_12_FULL_60_15]